MFYIQICVLEPEPVGTELLQVKPEPKFFTWSRSRKKNIWSRGKMARLRNIALMSTGLPVPGFVRIRNNNSDPIFRWKKNCHQKVIKIHKTLATRS